MSLLQDILSIVRGEEPLHELGTGFLEMLDIAEHSFSQVNVALWAECITEELLEETRKQDVKLNKLERRVRKRVLNHLVSNPEAAVIPYCFILISVSKDAERIGDYIKNLCELPFTGSATMPEGELKDALRKYGRTIEQNLARVGPVFKDSLRAEAEELVRTGRVMTKELDALFPKIASAGFSSESTTTLVLTARFYKRIAAHLVNILSTVIMPFHKIDFFDERELE